MVDLPGRGGETRQGLVVWNKIRRAEWLDRNSGGTMRRLTFAAIIAFALILASVAPAFAYGGPSGHGASFNVWGTTNANSHPQINGFVNVPDGTQGIVNFDLQGSKDGSTWGPVGKVFTFNTVLGRTSYSFAFDLSLDKNQYNYYRVVGGGSQSRNFNKDECGFRVPEAPATPLLLLGAFPAFGLIAAKATGVRIPVPNLHRTV